MEFVETRLLPLLVLLLAGYAAFGDPPAWSWVHVVGTALAAVVLARAIPEAPSVFAEPLTTKVGAFTTGRLLLPILIGLTSLLALLVGAPVALETGVVFSIALAVIALL